MMKLLILIGCFLLEILISKNIKGQGLDANGLRFSLSVSNHSFLEIGYIRFKAFGSHTPEGLIGSFISVAKGLNDYKDYVIPKVGIEYDYWFLGTRLSLINETNFSTNKLYFLPEIGVTVGGIASLLYGYNFPLGADNYQLLNHNISVTCLIPFKWLQHTIKFK